MDTSEFVKLTPKTVAELVGQRRLRPAKNEPLGRRREPRWPFPGTVELWIPEGGSDRPVFATAVNISSGGIAIRCDERLELGTPLPIAVHLPQATYHGQAVARHVTETPEDFIIGLQFSF